MIEIPKTIRGKAPVDILFSFGTGSGDYGVSYVTEDIDDEGFGYGYAYGTSNYSGSFGTGADLADPDSGNEGNGSSLDDTEGHGRGVEDEKDVKKLDALLSLALQVDL